VKKDKRKESILPAVPFFPIRESRKPAIAAPLRRNRVSEKVACEMASRKIGEVLGRTSPWLSHA